jgi:hypothetical protein
MSVRYVVTGVFTDGTRGIVNDATFDEPDAAQKWATDAAPDMYARTAVRELEVRPVECWDMKDTSSIHKFGDPKDQFFDLDWNDDGVHLMHSTNNIEYTDRDVVGLKPFLYEWRYAPRSSKGEALLYTRTKENAEKLITAWDNAAPDTWRYRLLKELGPFRIPKMRILYGANSRKKPHRWNANSEIWSPK